MKKLSLRWRITFMTMIILVVTCVSMKVMICSSGMMQITELGNVVFDFTDDHKGEVVTAEEMSGFERQFAGKLQEAKIAVLHVQLVYHRNGRTHKQYRCVFYQQTISQAAAKIFKTAGKDPDEKP